MIGSFQEGLAIDVFLFFENFELSVGASFSDIDVFGEVMILLGRNFPPGTVERNSTLERFHDFGWLEARIVGLDGVRDPVGSGENPIWIR